MVIEPITLEGSFVRLEPLRPDHEEGLAVVGLDPELWRWTLDRIEKPADIRASIASALKEQAEGSSLPFATIHEPSGRVVGATRFLNIAPAHRRVEIGSTWVAVPWQRTAVNTEAKLLMLAHAFEVWKCLRVELKTDALNTRSRAAILRLGAREEGVLRSHMICQDGRVRDTVYFSILDSEWPDIKTRLQESLARS